MTDASATIRDFRDGKSHPTLTSNEVMIVGTGGVHIWERLWQDMTRDPQDRERTLRAMTFADGLTREDSIRLLHAQHSFFHLSREAIRMRQSFQERLNSLGPEIKPIPRRPESGANRFARHLPDWYRRAGELGNIAQDTLEMGQHLALIAILAEDPQALDQAVRTSADAAQWFTDQVRELDPGQDRPRPPTWDPTGEPETMAEERLEYVRRITDEHQPRNEARKAVGSAVIARDLRQVDLLNRDPLWNMERSFARSALRNLNDEVCRYDLTGARKRARQALVQDSPEELQQATSNLLELAGWITRQTRQTHESVEARVTERRRMPANPMSLQETVPQGPVARALRESFHLHMTAAADRSLDRPLNQAAVVAELDLALTMEEFLALEQ